MNEGHSAFLGLERIRDADGGAPARLRRGPAEVMATNVFTTHTPVPAGIDMFPPS